MSKRSAVFIQSLQRIHERVGNVRADSSAHVWFDDILNQLVEDEQAFCAARHRVERGAQWQPIETAPKDGTAFLAYSPRPMPLMEEVPGQSLVYRASGETVPRDCVLAFWWSGDSLNQPGWTSGTLPEHPTHWMPLPIAPTA